MNKTIPVITGNWGKDISWELYASSEWPPMELVTAVFCVAITDDNKVILAQSERGWGLLGGHVEADETILEALIRESHEESGFTPEQPQLFAFRKIIASHPISHQNSAKHYPFPISYLLYYWATTNSPLTKPTGKEIIESGLFNLSELKMLDTPDLPIIELGYKAFEEAYGTRQHTR